MGLVELSGYRFGDILDIDVLSGECSLLVGREVSQVRLEGPMKGFVPMRLSCRLRRGRSRDRNCIVVLERARVWYDGVNLFCPACRGPPNITAGCRILRNRVASLGV
jgi:hypothetical protein